MSIVPYNNSNQIVYYDSSRGILVLHNDEHETIELFSSPSQNCTTCPNCGYRWNNREEGLFGDFAGGPYAQMSDNSPAVYQTPYSPQFAHHDYFKLLGDLYNKNKEKINKVGSKKNSSLLFDSEDQLPGTTFNQGYFARFFRKIPPYILGSGAHAEVYKVEHILSNISLGVYAVKKISIGDRIKLLQQVLNEVIILYELSVQGANENNLIQYNHVWLEMGDINDQKSFILGESSSSQIPYVFILQQYCDGGHLEDLINQFLPERLSPKEKFERAKQKSRRRKLSNDTIMSSQDDAGIEGRTWLEEIEIFKFFFDIVRGVAYLHRHGILHRDLKPSNCLLDRKYKYVPFEEGVENGVNGDLSDYFDMMPKVLVSDFGEGLIINKNKQSLSEAQHRDRRGNTGTLEFTSPDLWLYDHPHHLMNDFTFESDIYSLGLILCWLCAGSFPFSKDIENLDDPQIMRQLIMDWYMNLTKKSFDDWFNISIRIRLSNNMITFRDLIYEMIKRENGTEKRIKVSEIYKLMEKMKGNFHERGRHDPGETKISGSKPQVHEVAKWKVYTQNHKREIQSIIMVLGFSIAYTAVEYTTFYNFHVFPVKICILLLGCYELWCFPNNWWLEIKMLSVVMVSLGLLISHVL